MTQENFAPFNCSLCLMPIFDRFYLKISNLLCHESCANCSICGQSLCGQQTCFERDGIFYCRAHNFRLISHCAGCREPISSEELVYKIQPSILYHVKCHRCSLCSRQLVPGEQIKVEKNSKKITCLEYCDEFNAQFYAHNNNESVYGNGDPQIASNFLETASRTQLIPTLLEPLEVQTSLDSEKLIEDNLPNIIGKTRRETLQNESNDPAEINDKSKKISIDDRINGDRFAEDQQDDDNLNDDSHNEIEQQCPGKNMNLKGKKCSGKVVRKEKSREVTPNKVAQLVPIPQYPFEMYAEGERYAQEQEAHKSSSTKRRGPRTTIRQEQLDILNRIFSTTPKPSKHARAKLAMDAGLSMRVIQVWFQNRRSKERRLKHLCNFLRHYEQNSQRSSPHDQAFCEMTNEDIIDDNHLVMPVGMAPDDYKNEVTFNEFD